MTHYQTQARTYSQSDVETMAQSFQELLLSKLKEGKMAMDQFIYNVDDYKNDLSEVISSGWDAETSETSGVQADSTTLGDCSQSDEVKVESLWQQQSERASFEQFL